MADMDADNKFIDPDILILKSGYSDPDLLIIFKKYYINNFNIYYYLYYKFDKKKLKAF